MPIKPRQDESQDAFISRCIETERENGYGEEQAAAICYRAWQERNQQHAIRSNEIGPSDRAGVRWEVFEGRSTLVVPVVMIVEGVLNGALVPREEFGRYPQAWNGEPVPVLHPEEQGSPIQANLPDVIERNTIGRVFNAYAEGDKLKAELWIDAEKARRLGHGGLVESLEAGECIEVSTGYFADSEMTSGTFNGREFQEIHRNIRPDHLALLPGEVGACSIRDGCGTRVNSGGFLMQAKEAVQAIANSLGLRANVEEGSNMTEHRILTELRQNKAIKPEHLQMLQKMDSEQLDMVAAIVDKMRESAGRSDSEGEGEPRRPEGEMEGDKQPEGGDEAVMRQSAGQQPAVNQDDIRNMVNEQLRRERVADRLRANAQNPFKEEDLQSMNVEQLERVEEAIRPADYSGAAGFAANVAEPDDSGSPLVPGGVLINTGNSEG